MALVELNLLDGRVQNSSAVLDTAWAVGDSVYIEDSTFKATNDVAAGVKDFGGTSIILGTTVVVPEVNATSGRLVVLLEDAPERLSGLMGLLRCREV